jgi:hypothetical protein
MSAGLKFSNRTDDEFKDIRRTLAEFRNPPKGSHVSTLARYEQDELVLRAIWDDCCDRCDILHDNVQSYIFVHATKKLISIDGGLEFANWLINYGLYPHDALCSKARDTIGVWAFERGRKVELRSIAHFDEASHTLYLHLGNGRMCRISAHEISEEDNGADGVLFRSAGQQAFDIDLNDLPTCRYGLKVTPDSPLCGALGGNWLGNPADQHQLWVCRFFSMLFPGMFGASSIVLNSGEHRSGKTSAAAKIGWLLMGKDFNVTMLNRDIKDVETTLTNDFLVVLDNVDSAKSLRAIEDLIAVAATGGSIKRRRLYTNNAMVTCPIVSQIYFTSRGKPIVRNDIVDRTLTFTFGKYDEPGGPQALSEKAIQQSVLAVRDNLMAEVIVRCQKILQGLYAKRAQSYSSSFRIKDFGRFCLATADAEGWHSKMTDIFARVAEEQSETSLEGNPIYGILRLWIGVNSKNLFNPISAADLDRGLAEIADSAGIHYSARSNPPFLSRLLNESKSEFDSAIGMKITHDKKCKRSLFSFDPVDQTKMQCVEEALRSLSNFAGLQSRVQRDGLEYGTEVNLSLPVPPLEPGYHLTRSKQAMRPQRSLL